MSTIDRPRLAPLVAGERMAQPEFHDRYAAMPAGSWFELIGGVVHMSSPVGLAHSYNHGFSMTWLGLYSFRTPGVEAYDNGSVALNEDNELQPDACLRIVHQLGRSASAKGIIHGAPELVVEVALSSRSIDLGPKLAEYERAGTLEYIVQSIEPGEILWHVRRDGRFVRKVADPDGIYRSEAFPGLHLDPVALLGGDGASLLAALERGLASPEHAAFVARLAAARTT